MTKQAVIAIVVAVIIILGAAGAFLYSQAKPANQKSNSTTTASQVTKVPKNEGIQTSLEEILTSGKTSKCTFTSKSDGSQTSGTLYTSGDFARGDFETKIGNKNTSANMIRNGNTFYMWGDSLPMGIKMTMSVNEITSKIEEDNSFKSFIPDKELSVNCVSWTEDKSLFTPPTTVKFTSIDSMMPESSAKTSATPTGTGSPQSGDSNECNICNSLTGQAKSVCVAQFNCQ